MGREADLAALRWLIELGADEAIGEHPVDRFRQSADALPAPSRSRAADVDTAAEAPADVARPARAPNGARTAIDPALPFATTGLGAADHIAAARRIAAGCTDLAALRDAVAAFDGCILKQGAQTSVFADGSPAARVMVVGEAPGREEDKAGLPFVGRSGQLLDRMLGAIGLSRKDTAPERGVYITNVIPWRPPENRDPSADEAAMMKAFLVRHIELAAPRVLLLMGRTAASTLMETTVGITRLRGTWTDVLGRPAMPTFHPAALLRNPVHKRLVWADLLSLRAHLDGGAP